MGKKDRYKNYHSEESVSAETTPVESAPVAVADEAARRLPRPQPNRLKNGSTKQTSFRAWFSGKTSESSQDRRLAKKGYKFDEILAYFRGIGLGETESASSYEQAIRAYFGE